MPRVFNISSASDAVALDASGRGTVVFTVTNASGRPLRGRFRTRSLDGLGAGAFAIEGESERPFNPNDTQQVSVKLNLPPGTAAGKYRFRLDAVSVDNPDEDFAEGPALTIDAGAQAPARRAFPWWIVAVAVLVLAVGGVVGFMAMHKDGTVQLVDVTGQPYAQARQRLEALELVVVPSDAALAGAPAARVVQQSPLPRTTPTVRKGSTVTLTLAAAGPPMVELPLVTGRSYEEARDTLSALGLVVKRGEQATADTPAGQVLAQAPPPSMVERGSEVTLTVAAAAAPAENPFIGWWINHDSVSHGVTHLVIERAGTAFAVRPIGKCFSQDCNWSQRTGTLNGNHLIVNDTFAAAGVPTLYIDMTIDGNALKVSSRYSDGQKTEQSDDMLVRQTPQERSKAPPAAPRQQHW